MAVHCTRGNIELTYCRACALVFNRSFDASLLDYGGAYENSLSSSPAFQRYSDELVTRLCNTYDLHRKEIAGIGSGRGEFLEALCKTGKNYATGYDPSYGGEDRAENSRVRFVQDYFSERYACRPVDFVSCRHVLEHIDEPARFLAIVRKALANKEEAAAYFEVPNGEHVLAGPGLWDIIYPHVSYFTAATLERLFRLSGFDIVRGGTSFGDQFLFVEARAGRGEAGGNKEPNSALAIETLIEGFDRRFAQAVLGWVNFLRSAFGRGKRVAFWGAGAKGVNFLNLVPLASNIGVIVDANVRKQGMYVPGTGQLIASPEWLAEYRPDFVIVLNASYQEEIASTLAAMGVRAALVIDPRPAAAAAQCAPR